MNAFYWTVPALKSLTSDGRNRDQWQYRPHREICLPKSCLISHGSTTTRSGPGSSLHPIHRCRRAGSHRLGFAEKPSAAYLTVRHSPLIASMATLALISVLWVRRLLIGGSPFQGGAPPQKLSMCPVQKCQYTSEW